jgi:hypothetical protein
LPSQKRLERFAEKPRSKKKMLAKPWGVRPGVGTSLGKAGVITCPKRFKSLLLYGEVGKAALMAWRASCSVAARRQSPEAAERRALARGLTGVTRTELL